ncbi:MAG: SGNH/GDSL hydrolase family protein [Chloroflexi bacterium]|nr:SGNH/GDSL hydrolase family protein [Chloroflexota bacterium]
MKRRWFALIGLLLALPAAAAAQDYSAHADGMHPVYALPDATSPPLFWLESSPVALTGRSADAVWVQIALASGGGWMRADAVQTGLDISGLPVVDVSPEMVLDGVLFWNVTPFAREIFAYGQEQGGRANWFSKVGDSITVSAAFLHPFGAGVYDLGEYAAELSPTLEFFGAGRADNPFSRRSQAAGVGWRAADLLAANAGGGCWPGESPLECEYREARPAVALIMIGTNDVVQKSPDDYRRGLSRIVETSLRFGVLPVLSTIPTLHGYEDEARAFNRIIVETAAAHGVPLWNYALALRGLPNDGLSRDGVHPSTPPDRDAAAVFTPENRLYGYTMRNLTALKLLQLLLDEVMND